MPLYFQKWFARAHISVLSFLILQSLTVTDCGMEAHRHLSIRSIFTIKPADTAIKTAVE